MAFTFNQWLCLCRHIGNVPHLQPMALIGAVRRAMAFIFNRWLLFVQADGQRQASPLFPHQDPGGGRVGRPIHHGQSEYGMVHFHVHREDIKG